jgi:restriction endonuclease S subunit
MPQISHIKFKDITEARRYDAEYFKPKYLKDDKNLDKFGFHFLNDISEVKGGKRLPLGESFSQDGIPYIRAEDIKNDFVQYENVPRISEELHKKLHNYQTKKGDVLLNIVGSVGGIGLVFFNIKKCNLTENACKITSSDKLNPETVFAYLLSKYGQNQIHREKVGTVQEKLALERIRRFKMPVFRESFQDQIKDKIDLSYQKQEESEKLYKEAGEILLSELGLLNFKPQNFLTFSTTKKEIGKAHRFDGEYFEPKYDDIIERIEKYSGGWDFVKKVINFKDKNFGLKTDQKYKYLALSNISNQGYVTDYQEELGKDLPSRARRKINTGDVIISSIEGSLSSCAIIEEEFDNAICSTGFFVVNSEKINPETLLILFKSNIIQELLIRGSKGTILTAISKSEIESIKIPLLKKTIQDKIAEKITKSHKLRKESKELLESAKKMVEEEIEKSK